MKNTIAIITDFSLDYYYVGVMKGVITSINPSSNIIDINHNISQGNIKQASYQLSVTYKYFPENTIFMIVVDPGVGTSRKAIIVKTDKYIFVAPDNGVLTHIIQYENIQEIIEIDNSRFFLQNTSNTFHGRDIFSPVSAYLSTEIDIKDFGKNISKKDIISLDNIQYKLENNKIIGYILDIDNFGNIISNIPYEVIKNRNIKYIQIKNTKIDKISKSYGEVRDNKLVALIGSSGFLEISVNMGNAKEYLNINYEEEIICFFD